MEVHRHWSAVFRTSENDGFYNVAFDLIGRYFESPGDRQVLDVGCGSATKSLHLAHRGYRVLAVDISESILNEARDAVAENGLSAKVEFRVEDLTRLSLRNSSQSRALVWGVLMHVPDVDAAIAELARVTMPGGLLIVSEGNKRSLQAFTLRWLKTLLGRERARIVHTPAGIEFWEETSHGQFMTRQADIPWLIRQFESRGFELLSRRAGQFTEIYTLFKWRALRSVVHSFNQAWFHTLRWGGPAFGNLLVFRKKNADSISPAQSRPK
jgi:ubiquinone/menaquinone biosynthesis C-methylase UbiE